MVSWYSLHPEPNHNTLRCKQLYWKTFMLDSTVDIGRYCLCHSAHLLTFLNHHASTVSKSVSYSSWDFRETPWHTRQRCLLFPYLPILNKLCTFISLCYSWITFLSVSKKQFLSSPTACLSSAGFFIRGTVHKQYAENVITNAPLCVPPSLLVPMRPKFREEHWMFQCFLRIIVARRLDIRDGSCSILYPQNLLALSSE